MAPPAPAVPRRDPHRQHNHPARGPVRAHNRPYRHPRGPRRPGAGWAARGSVAGLVSARRWRHHRRYILPLRRALTPALSGPPPRLAIAARTGPRSRSGCPKSSPAATGNREEVTRAVTAKVAIEAPDTEWNLNRLDGRNPHVVTFTHQPAARQRPPSRHHGRDRVGRPQARSGHVRPRQEGTRSQAYRWTTTARTSACQWARATARPSPARNMRRPAPAPRRHRGCTRLQAHLPYVGARAAERRLRGHPRRDRGRDGAGSPPKCAAATASPWPACRHRGPRPRQRGPTRHDLRRGTELPRRQPAQDAWWNQADGQDEGPVPGSMAAGRGDLAFAGRQVYMHVWFIGQMLTAKATGASDSSVRGNIGILIFADPTASTWKKIVGDRPMPPCPDIPGRIQVTRGGYPCRSSRRSTVRPMTQGAFWTWPAGPRDYAVSGCWRSPRLGCRA